MKQYKNRNEIEVSVIIPVYNDTKSLVTCLKALALQDIPKSRIEIIVIDNGSRLPIDLSKMPSNVKIIVESKPGSYAARNAGISIATSELLAFTDVDCIPDRNWLSQALLELKKYGQNAIIGGAINVTPQEKGKPNLFEAYDIALGLRQDRYVSMGNFAATANMITWKSLFYEVGFFNPELKSGGDYEWGNRAVRQNKKLHFCPKVIVTHPARNTLKSIVTKTRRISGGIVDIETKKVPQAGEIKGIEGTPFASLRSVFINEDLPRLSQKIGVLLVAATVLASTMIEKLRLKVGFDSERR